MASYVSSRSGSVLFPSFPIISVQITDFVMNKWFLIYSCNYIYISDVFGVFTMHLVSHSEEEFYRISW